MTKKINKQRQQFSVITTLCLVLVSLFGVAGCIDPENPKPEPQPEYYTVNFVSDGVIIVSQSIRCGSYATAPENPEREGYDFGGWFTDYCTFVNEWIFKTSAVTQDTALYAKWDENDLLVTTLQGTKWKLIGIVDVQTCTMTELDPGCNENTLDCDEFYTLTFHTENTFSGRPTNNWITNGKYEIDYIEGTFKIISWALTQMGDLGDGYLYLRILSDNFFKKYQPFGIKNTHPRILHLYYNDRNNYLKYYEIGGLNE